MQEATWKEPEGTEEFDQIVASLRDAGDEVLFEITRTQPQQCKGYMGDIVPPDAGVADIKRIISQNFGGGDYKIKLKGRVNGKLLYKKGSAFFSVAGEPRQPNGDRYPHIVASLPAPTPQVMVHPPALPPAPAPGESINNKILELYTGAIERSLGNGGIDLGQLVELTNAIRGTITPVAAPVAAPVAIDPIEMVERQVTAFARIKKLFGGDNAQQKPKSDEMDDSDIMRAVLPAIAQKLLGTPATPAPTPAPAQTVAQQESKPALKKIPDGYVWHPKRGIIRFEEHPPRDNDASAEAMPVASPPPKKPEPVPQDEEETSEEPLSAAEIEEEFDAMSAEDQQAFMMAIARRAGIDLGQLAGGTLKTG